MVGSSLYESPGEYQCSYTEIKKPGGVVKSALKIRIDPDRYEIHIKLKTRQLNIQREFGDFKSMVSVWATSELTEEDSS